MVCIQCGSDTQVVNSRHQKRANQVWRRRKCVNCQAIFSTAETADYTASWTVIAKNSAHAPFSRDTLFISLYNSLQHRSTAVSDAASLTATIMSKLAPLVTDGALHATDIKTATQVALNRFDAAASVHYQAFHS